MTESPYSQKVPLWLAATGSLSAAASSLSETKSFITAIPWLFLCMLTIQQIRDSWVETLPFFLWYGCHSSSTHRPYPSHRYWQFSLHIVLPFSIKTWTAGVKMHACELVKCKMDDLELQFLLFGWCRLYKTANIQDSRIKRFCWNQLICSPIGFHRQRLLCITSQINRSCLSSFYGGKLIGTVGVQIPCEGQPFVSKMLVRAQSYGDTGILNCKKSRPGKCAYLKRALRNLTYVIVICYDWLFSISFSKFCGRCSCKESLLWKWTSLSEC